MSLDSNIDDLISKIRQTIENTSPNSPEIKAGYVRIAGIVTSRTKINIRKQGLIDTGRLLNSIRHEFFKEGTVLGIRS